MYKNKSILVCIPARGGSKGIPRKNLRLMNGKPLISYTINAALNSKLVDKVIVSTDDEEIKQTAIKYGANVIDRDSKIAEDSIPLDPVIYDAVSKSELLEGVKYDIVLTVQPTSPLLKTETINNIIEKICDNEEIDTIISVMDDRHLSWTRDKDGNAKPKYEKRLNRQYLPEEYRETGAVLATRRNCVTEKSRIGEKVDLFVVSKDESTDIDAYEDWWVAEKLLKRKKIVIRVDATNEIGTGHIYRQLYIASRIMDHEVKFVLNAEKKLGIDIVNRYNYPNIVCSDDGIKEILELKPDIVINDILNTDEKYIKKLKENDIFVINFEDMGDGARYADLVFNALYEYKMPLSNIYGGYKYYLLRDEFKSYESKVINKDVSNILITFGGTDPNNFTEKVLSTIKDNKNINITVILGLGYKYKNEFKEKYKDIDNIKVIEFVKDISTYMYNSDLVITSGGRTMYEVASLGIPCIVLCQNERELSHLFGHAGNGIINLGLGEHINEAIIKSTINEVIENYELRLEMNKKMKNIDLTNGFNNIMNVVTEKYKLKK